MYTTKLPRNQIKGHWKFNDNGLKKICFQNFSQALSFIVQVS
jgi:hypothetical protein